jgi:hypothetical protein
MPDPNVSTFTAQFLGGARPNRFDAMISYPMGGDTQKFSFMCKALAIPSSKIEKVEVPYQSRNIPVAGDRTIDDLSLTIINDKDFVVRKDFETWMNKIYSHLTNVAEGGWHVPSSYYGTLTLTQWDREYSQSRVYNFFQIFPTEVSEITLGWGENNSIEEFTVTLAVTWWGADTTT